MAARVKSRWYIFAKLFALLFVVVGLWLFVFRASPSSDCYNCATVDVSPLLGIGALFFTGLATISSIILGWRSERRQADESRLKIAHLELQLEQARAANKTSA